ncbi:SspB family protein [Terrihabitans rhizophilus]|uniref:ClpXP protease specificity-enhancing factor SspB n=1 Tax=Terrihabitans rhizophilus TaxID=3092662 RepID=A0ABU4RPE3_9HYPH|nr:ClpXP protease specificity-enhancing factor SspB [Terrihabitans sp. PJ23]MDX6805570.1 ClpXP protease specificity-enhancing factor SspB [Terrihabitans sp. PJ23]
MSTDLIRYDLLAQEALRGVVRRVLEDVSRTGLPGEHHFYISFNTEFPGVRISPRLREKYPEEMTIVIQHQFWDLNVEDHDFQIGLSFSNIPEMLHVPFDAITGFFDPSVKFGLKFEPLTPVDEDGKTSESSPAPAAVPAPASEVRSIVPAARPAKAEAEDEKAASENGDETEEKPEGAQIVSLDKFRKK